MRQKKSLFSLLILTMFLTFNLISCSGGGGGGGAAVGPTTASGFIKIVEATGTASGANIGGADSARYMMLYRAQDIQASGMISVISLKRSDVMGSSINCPNVTVKMGHTNVTGLYTTFANNIEQGQGAFTTVINNASINVPAGAADTYFDITLPQAFNYNGVDNLIVEITRTSACTDALPVAHHVGYDGANMNTSSSTATTGTVYPVVVDARFVFSGGDNIAVAGARVGNLNPFGFSLGLHKMQLLYTADEVNGSGSITGIAFPAGALTDGGDYTLSVRMGHTTRSQLTDTFANNFNSGSPVAVASSANFSVPAGVPTGSYIWIPMPDATFNYNGTSNLIVELEVTSSNANTSWGLKDTTTDGRRLYAAAGGTTGDVDGAHYCIKFRFAGGTMDVIEEQNGGVSIPFWNSTDHKLQYLYRAAELGTKGNISRVAFRLQDWDSSASSYDSFTVVMGHTANAGLGLSFAGNMTGAQTVYSGTFSVPAGLKKGDWIEILLTTPFAYDGVRNLVVQTSGLKGSATNNLILNDNYPRYMNRYVEVTGDGTNTASSADYRFDFIADLRLTLE
ncbi:MAG TPA: hypothetical protein P5294_09745 [Smithellaceae bacterium]|nr:hypothetical protein [Smithellaceae bacterium]HRS90223.1 hypothetical protein [Smithellaceae bacterium]HRV26813.1 hypothetical protein [Smithellaceae bacterium]